MRISTLGGCPKCKGFLMLEKDMHGLYQQCLQCGYIRDLVTVDSIDEQEVAEEMDSEASLYAAINSADHENDNASETTECHPAEPAPQVISNSLQQGQ